MSNRSSSKQHGHATTNITRPKSKLRHRLNKAKARDRREERHAALEKARQEALDKIK